MSVRRRAALASLVVLIGAQGALQGQSETTFQYNLSNPGARSLAMGGAFLGLADDATAAYTNPAGLTNLTVGGSEVTVEYRNWDYTTLFPERGNVGDGEPTGIGLDTVAGVRTGESQSTVSGISFLSFGYILPRGVTLAVYRHELARFQAEKVNQGIFFINEDEIPVVDCQSDSDGNPCRIPPLRTKHDLEIVNYGISAAYEIPDLGLWGEKDSLSLGIGVSYFEADLEAQGELFGFLDPTGNLLFDRQPGSFFGPPDFLEDYVIGTSITRGTDSALGWNAGFLWKPGTKGCCSIGGVYRRGPRFDAQVTVFAGRPVLGLRVGSGKTEYRVPDSYGLGMAYRSRNDNTKIALDYDRIRYSQRLDELVPRDAEDRNNYGIRDSGEIHLGLEQIVLTIGSQFVGTLRLGAWYDPAHELEYSGQERIGRTLISAGDDKVRWSAGVGLVVKEDFQIDAAIERSDLVNTFSFSVVRFF